MLQEMKAVGNLDGTGSPLPNAGGIRFGSITRDNRDVGMRLQPRGHGFRRSILK
jgi:hypothetical protein